MEFKQREELDGKVVVIEIPERLTTETADDLKLLFKELIAGEQYRIVLDLSNTRYMDSSGLGAIVSKISVLRSNSGDIKLACAQQYILDLLELTHINQILRTYDSVDLAVSSFQG